MHTPYLTRSAAISDTASVSIILCETLAFSSLYVDDEDIVVITVQKSEALDRYPIEYADVDD